MCFGSNIVETTTKQELPEWLESAAKNLVGQTEAVTGPQVPYVPYGGQRLAPLTTEQQMARQQAVEQAQAYRPDLAMARGLGGVGSAPISGQDIERYRSPYIDQVMTKTLDELQRRSDIQGQKLSDAAVKAGAYGGSRFGVQQAEQQRNLQDVQARTAAQLQEQAYRNAMSMAQNERARQLQGAGTFGAIGGQEMKLGQAGMAGLQQAGQLGQQQLQRGMDITYGDFQRQQQFPYEQIRFGAGILGGVPSPMTTYQQQPTASGAQQIAGLGLAGIGAYNAGFFSDAQLKENLELIGTSPSNINIYSFNYKGSKDKYQGVIAQEVPWASMKHNNGYLLVDYSKLDVNFKKLN